MKHRIHALLVWACAMCAVSAQGTGSLKDVVTNTKKSGTLLLDQGYRGKFTKTFCEPNEPLKSPVVFEFTHGLLNDRILGSKAPPVQKIAVGIVVPASSGYERFRSPAIYCDSIPDFQRLSELASIEEFERIFEVSKDFTPPWAFDGEVAYSDRTWMAFTTQPDSAIRVVSVTLTVAKSSVGAKITKKCIQEGVFHATGRPPVLEAPEKKEVEQSADGQPATAPESKSEGVERPRKNSDGRSR